MGTRVWVPITTRPTFKIQLEYNTQYRVPRVRVLQHCLWDLDSHIESIIRTITQCRMGGGTYGFVNCKKQCIFNVFPQLMKCKQKGPLKRGRNINIPPTWTRSIICNAFVCMVVIENGCKMREKILNLINSTRQFLILMAPRCEMSFMVPYSYDNVPHLWLQHCW